MNLGVLLLAALPLLAKDAKPDWLSGASAQYPKGAYLVGVGQDSSQEKAADRARAEIAKTFSLTVVAESNQSLSEKNGAESQSISDEVRTSTQKVIDTVEIASYWDDGKGTIYALAVLNKEHGLAVIKDKLAELDNSAPDLQDAVVKADGKFAKLKAALKLLRAAKSRRRLNADCRVLAADGKGIPAPAALEQALPQARAAVQAVTIQIDATGVETETTASRLIDGLSAYGLKVVEKGAAPADVIVEAKASAENLEAEDLTWYWAHGAVRVKMRYGATGEVFQRFEEAGQEASRDPSTSVGVTVAKLADRAADHAFKVLTSNSVLDE